METTVNANEAKSTAPPPKENPEGPIQILVKTKTHLVPGDDYDFGYDNRTCYFLVDHGKIC